MEKNDWVLWSGLESDSIMSQKKYRSSEAQPYEIGQLNPDRWVQQR